MIRYHGCAYLYFVHLKAFMKELFFVIASNIVWKVSFNSRQEEQDDLYGSFQPKLFHDSAFQYHTSCKQRTGCLERCLSVLASNSCLAQSSAMSRRWCLESRTKCLLSAGLLLLPDSPQDFSAPHEVGTGSLTKMLLSTPWCCKEMREEEKRPQSLLTGGGCQCHWAQSSGITGLFILFST